MVGVPYPQLFWTLFKIVVWSDESYQSISRNTYLMVCEAETAVAAMAKPASAVI